MITIGGFLSDEVGIKSVEHLYHNYGDDDWMQALGAIFWFGRWPLVLKSGWNRMLAQGKMTFKDLGPITQLGPRCYFDEDTFNANKEQFTVNCDCSS